MFPTHFVTGIIYIISAWKFGKWRDWRIYHSTILFLIMMDFLGFCFQYDYQLWTYEPTLIMPNNLLADIFIAITTYPSMVLLFLPYFPKHHFFKKIAYIVAWTSIASFLEWIVFKIGNITYHHGWSFRYTVLFYLMMFTFIYLHHKKPLLAYLLSIPVIVLLLWFFQVPILNPSK